MKAIGIDIGTTTICSIVLDCETKEVCSSLTLPNRGSRKHTSSFEKSQDPGEIIRAVKEIYQALAGEYPDVVSLGLSGQMHGILYVDRDGEAVSPLYTWQDERGSEIYQDNKTYGQYLTQKLGYPMASGYGITTHFYQLKNSLVPEEATCFCTIGDYAVMKLTGRKTPLMSTTNAAGLGGFDGFTMDFDRQKLKEAGIDCEILPEVTDDFVIAGKTKEGILVSLAIGDNQASVLGTVSDLEHTVLLNVGTGSQISAGTRVWSRQGIELRPCTKDYHLMVGACLCGGRAYAALEQFFQGVYEMIEGKNCGNVYEQMYRILGEKEETEPLKICTTFQGTRENPDLRGSVAHISLDNFTPEAFIRGVLSGMVTELYDYYEIISRIKKKPCSILVGSGNGLRLNPFLCRLVEERFGMKLYIPKHREEASFGACLVSLVAAGVYDRIEKAQQMIQYL